MALPKGLPLFFVNNDSAPSSSSSSDPSPTTSTIELLPIQPLGTDFGVESNDSNIVFVSQSGTPTHNPDIKAATLAKLIEYLTHDEYTNPLFVRQFLLSFHSFTDAETLMRMLYDRFVWLPKSNSEHYVAHMQKLVQFRVYNVLKIWVSNHYLESFYGQNELLGMLLWFLEQMSRCGMDKYSSSLANEVERKQKDPYGQIMSLAVVANRMKPITPKRIRSVLDIDPEELARQFCLIEHELFRQIRSDELLGLRWSKKRELAPNVMKQINWTNRIVRWVSTVVVTEPSVKKRTRIVQLLIDTAEACRRMNNFNALFEIISGLNSSACFRLRKTWAAIGRTYEARFHDVSQVLSSAANYKYYRELLSSVAPPIVPYVGRILTDLTFIEDGNADTLGELINFDKRRHVSKVIEDVLSYQAASYPFFKVKIIDDFLKTTPACSEKELYDHSLAREKKVASGETEALDDDEKVVVRLEEDFGELELVPNYPFAAPDQPGKNVVTDDGLLVGATFAKLVERATASPVVSLANASMSEVAAVLLCCYQRFVTGEQLIALLRHRFFMPKPLHCTPELLAHFDKIRCIPIRLRTVALVNRWVNKFAQNLRSQPPVAAALVSFLHDACVEDAVRTQCLSLIDAIDKLTTTTTTTTTTTEVPVLSPPLFPWTMADELPSERSTSADFLRLPSREITRHLHGLCLQHFWPLTPADFFAAEPTARLDKLHQLASDLRSLFLSELARPSSGLEAVQVFLHVLCVLEDSLACENHVVVAAIVAALAQSRSTYEPVYAWLIPSLAEAVERAVDMYTPTRPSAPPSEWATDTGVPPAAALYDVVHAQLAGQPDYVAPDVINYKKYRAISDLLVPSLFLAGPPAIPRPSDEMQAYLERTVPFEEFEYPALLARIQVPADKPMHPLLLGEEAQRSPEPPRPAADEEAPASGKQERKAKPKAKIELLKSHSQLAIGRKKISRTGSSNSSLRLRDKDRNKETPTTTTASPLAESSDGERPGDDVVSFDALQERLTNIEFQNKLLADQNRILVQQHQQLESLVRLLSSKLLAQVRPLEPQACE